MQTFAPKKRLFLWRPPPPPFEQTLSWGGAAFAVLEVKVRDLYMGLSVLLYLLHEGQHGDAGHEDTGDDG